MVHQQFKDPLEPSNPCFFYLQNYDVSPKKYVTRAPLSWIKTMVQAVFTIPMGRAVNRPVSLRIGSQGLSRRGQSDRSNQTLVSFPAKNWLVL